MRYLSYPEIFEMVRRERLTVDFDEAVFEAAGRDARAILELDHSLKDRAFDGHFLESRPNSHSMRHVAVHSVVRGGLWDTVAGRQVVTRGSVSWVPTVERIGAPADAMLHASFQLDDALYEQGFRCLTSGWIDLSTPFCGVLLTNVGRAASLIRADTRLGTIRLITNN